MNTTPLLLALTSAFTAHAQQPNVIVLLADDLGYGDLSTHSAQRVTTPTLINLQHAAHASPTLMPQPRPALRHATDDHRRISFQRPEMGVAQGDTALIIRPEHRGAKS